MEKNTELVKFKKEIRKAISDYMYSEGCDCCRSSNHEDNREKIAKLLNIRKNKDGSGYKF